MNQPAVKKWSIEDFNINPDHIPEEVKQIVFHLSPFQTAKINKKYDSLSDYISIWFHLRFIEKLEAGEIAEKLHITQVNARKRLYDLKWHYYPEYEFNKEKHLVEKAELDSLYEKYYKEALSLNINSGIVQEIFNKTKQLNPATFQSLGFNTAEEFVLVFYYLIAVKKMSLLQMSVLFDTNYSKIEENVKRLCIKNLYKNASQIKKNNKLNSGLDLPLFKNKISKLLINEFNKKAEIIIGHSSAGLADAADNDVPIIIHNPKTETFFRFIVKFTESSAKSRGKASNVNQNPKDAWIPILIPFPNNNDFNSEAEAVCTEIKTKIRSCES